MVLNLPVCCDTSQSFIAVTQCYYLKKMSYSIPINDWFASALFLLKFCNSSSSSVLYRFDFN